MKLNLILLFLAVISMNSYSQITLENSYNDVDRYSFTMVNLGTDGLKYMMYDEASTTINLFNPDHSGFKSVTLENLPIDSSYFYLTIQNVSQGLFSTDGKIDILLEYSYQNHDYETRSFVKVVDENNNVKFYEENSKLGFDNNINDGQFLFETINGAKLMVLNGESVANIYSLPGSLSPDIEQSSLSLKNDTLYLDNSSYVYLGGYKQKLSLSNDTIYLSDGGFVDIGSNEQTAGVLEVSKSTNSYFEVYPTYANDEISVEYELRAGSTGKVLFINNSGVVLKERDIYTKNGKMNIAINEITDGIYHVILLSEKGEISTSKIIVQK